MDNVSIHHSYSTLEVFKKLNLWIMYLPAYSPELAAIELLFRLINNKIRSWQSNQEYSFWNPKDRYIIFESITDTKQINIFKIWT